MQYETLAVCVGVSGHRDISDKNISDVLSATRKVLTDIAALTPNSAHVLISSLAEGGDRIAARCALEMGWQLGVVLPAAAAIYRPDFKTRQSQEEFDELMSQASWIHEVDPQNSQQPDYLAAGMVVMQCSLLLLAYWDSASPRLEGGTTDIVSRFLSDIPVLSDESRGDMTIDARPVIQIKVTRSGVSAGSDSSYEGDIVWLMPETAGQTSNEKERWQTILKRFDGFNLDAKACWDSSSDMVKKSLLELDSQGITEFSRLSKLAKTFALADVMSLQAQRERNWILYQIVGLTFLSVIFEHLYSDWHPFQGYLGVAVIFGLLAVAVYKTGKRRRIEDRYLDYRALAEACRVQYFWRKIGFEESVNQYFLVEQDDELEWIRRAVVASETPRTDHLAEQPVDFMKIKAVKQEWIDKQKNYFIGSANGSGKRKAYLHHEKEEFWSKTANRIFFTGVGLVIFLVFSRSLVISQLHEFGHGLIEVLDVSYGVLFALAGLIKVYQEVNAFSEHGRSYLKLGLSMSRASRHLDEAIQRDDIRVALAILHAVGCNSLDENADWLILHRDRPVQVSIG